MSFARIGTLLGWMLLVGCSNGARQEADRLYGETRYTEAATAYEPLVSTGKAELELQRRYALSMAHSGQATKAEPVLSALMQKGGDPEIAAAWIDVVTMLKGPEEGWAVAQEQLKRFMGEAAVRRAVGTLAAQRGDFAAARDHLEQALKLNPKLASAHANLGDLRLRAGDSVAAMEFYQRAIEQEPKSPMSVRIRVRLAQMLAETKPDQALNLLKEALQVEPNAPDALAELGKVMASMGLFDQAIDYLKEAYELKLERGDVMSTLGFAFLQRASRSPDAAARRQDLLAARMWLNRLIERQPSYRGAHNNLGKVLVQLGDGEQAEQAFRQELTLYPSSLEALTNLGRYLAEQGQLEQARELLVRAFEIDRRQVVLASELGRLALSQNDWSEAENWYQNAWQLCQQVAWGHPCRSDVPFQLARIAGRKRDKEGAVQYLLKALEGGFADLGRLRAEGELRPALGDSRIIQALSRSGTP